MITIRLSKAGNLYALFRRLEGVEWMTPPMKHTAEAVLSDLRRYPPPRQTRYVRTGDLAKYWSIKVGRTGGHSVQAMLDNPLRYAPYVQSDEFQAFMHRGVWPTEGEILESHESTIVQAFGEAMQSAWGGL